METQQKQFEIFQEECQKWIDALGLYDWDFYIDVDDLQDDRGQAIFDVMGKKAIIDIADKLEGCNGLECEIRRCARHEILHILIGKLYILAKNREWNESEYIIEEHSIINRLNKVLED